MIPVFKRLQNIVRKGENAGYSIFSFSHNVFKTSLFSGSFKLAIVWLRVKETTKATEKNHNWYQYVKVSVLKVHKEISLAGSVDLRSDFTFLSVRS